MSGLKNKLEKLAKKAIKKKAAYVNIDVTGYKGYKGEQMVFFIDCNDDEMKKKIMDNNLSDAERNFIVATVGEYFDETCRTDEQLFKLGVEDLVIMHMEGQMNIPGWLLNPTLLAKCSRKKQGTQEMAFNKSKFRSMPLSEKVNIVNDLMDFFMEIWGSDYLNKNSDINNLVRLNDSDNSDLNDEEEQLEQSEQPVTAITKSIRRRFIKM